MLLMGYVLYRALVVLFVSLSYYLFILIMNIKVCPEHYASVNVKKTAIVVIILHLSVKCHIMIPP